MLSKCLRIRGVKVFNSAVKVFEKSQSVQLLAPVSINDVPEIDLSSFRCGEPVLDRWLKLKSRSNERRGGSRTYVVLNKQDCSIVAYYCLSTYALCRSEVKGSLRRNMPNPIPVVLLGRLAVDLRYQGRSIGRALVKHALVRAKKVSEISGAVGLVTEAMSKSACEFYEHMGFRRSEERNNLLIIRFADLPSHQ